MQFLYFVDDRDQASASPASDSGLSDRGSLEPGKRADLVVLDGQTRRVAATFVKGRVSYMSGEIAERFLR